jgi:hypothetical protein
MQARYYASGQGRFASVDPANSSANTSDPQSWNGYAYARSNPGLYTDPGGRSYVVCDPSGKNCGLISDEVFWAEQKKLKGAGLQFSGNGDFFESGNITSDGVVQATYSQVSIDSNAGQLAYGVRQGLNDHRILENVGRNILFAAVIGKSGRLIAKSGAYARTIAQLITSKYGIFQCKPCAKELLKEFRKNGINARVLKVQVDGKNQNLWSDVAGDTISTSGNHWAVEVDGIVYDNIHKAGIPFDQWVKDLQTVGTSVKRVFTDVTNELLK